MENGAFALKFKKKLLNSIENIIENGAFALKSKCSIFNNIFKYMVFQRHYLGVKV